MSETHGHQSGAAVGWREIVGLPDLGIDRIKAKVDTGARTSALHADDRRVVERDGAAWISFTLPSPKNGHPIRCTAPLVDQRAIKNTSGVPETRHIIRTILVVGRRHWHIEISLSDRTEMEFNLILGRSALRRHKLLVNPARSFLAGPPATPKATARPASDKDPSRPAKRKTPSLEASLDNGEEE